MPSRWHPPWKVTIVETAVTAMTATLAYGYIIGKFVWCGNLWWVIGVSILFVYIGRPIIQSYIALIVLGITHVRILPRTPFPEGIPDEHRASFVYCVRATNKMAVKLSISNLRRSMADNADRNLYGIYLSDTSNPQLITEEIKAMRKLQEEIGRDRVFLFHRATHWGKKWGGYQDLMTWLSGKSEMVQTYIDEKYGSFRRDPSQKLFSFSCLNKHTQDTLLAADEATSGIIGDVSLLRNIDHPTIQYLLISDADVLWPEDTAIITVEKMAHPANREFAIFQPCVAIGNSNATLFTKTLHMGRQFGEFFGLAIWKVYDAYLFFGKGGIKLEAYMDTMMVEGGEVLNPNLLSHDFIEARYLRTAYLSDIRITENAPLDYLDDLARLERWFLGDILGLYYECIHLKLKYSPSPLVDKVRGIGNKPLPFVANSLTRFVIAFDFVPLAFSIFMVFMVIASYISGIYLIADRGAEIGVLLVVLAGILLVPRVLGPIISSFHLRRPVKDSLYVMQYAPLELFFSTVLFLQHLVDRNIILVKTAKRLLRFLRDPVRYPLEWEPSSVSHQPAMKSMPWLTVYWKQKGVVLTGIALVVLLSMVHNYKSLWYMSVFWVSFMLGPAMIVITGKGAKE